MAKRDDRFLIASCFDDFCGQAVWIRINHFMAAGHLHEAVKPESIGHARMPAPFAGRQRDAFRAIDVTARRCGAGLRS